MLARTPCQGKWNFLFRTSEDYLQKEKKENSPSKCLSTHLIATLKNGLSHLSKAPWIGTLLDHPLKKGNIVIPIVTC